MERRIAAASRWGRAAFFVLVSASQVDGQSYGTIPAQALTITGSAGGVVVPYHASQAPAGGFMIEAWVRYDPAAVGGFSAPTIVRKPQDDPSYLLRLTNTTNGSPEFYCTVNNSYVIVSGGGPITPNVWRHVAGTYDGAVVRLYLDGTLVASQSAPGTLTDRVGSMAIGRGSPFAGETWRGSIDAVRLWSTVKTGAQLAADSRLRLTAAPGLVSAWYFDGVYDDVVGVNDPVLTTQVALTASTAPVQVASASVAPTTGVGGVAQFACASVAPGVPYAFDFGVAGSTPGVPLPAPLFGSIPVNPPWIYWSYGGFLPAEWFGSFIGFTDAFGSASATFAVPPLAGLVGVPLTGAFTFFDVSAPFGVLAASNAAATVVVGPPPVVAGVAPSVVATSGGGALTVTGSGFEPGASVVVGGVFAGSVVVVSPTTITCTAPARPIGVYELSVVNPGPSAGSLPNALTYVPPIVVNTVLPTSAAPGLPVAVTGSGFHAGTTATLNGSPLVFVLQTATNLVFLAPPSVPCGAPLTFVDPATGLTVQRFWNLAPNVTSVSNAVGPASGGGAFTVIGTDFPYGSAVTVGGSPASVVAASSTSLSCIAPPGVVGPATLTVTTPTGCAATAAYTYQ